MLQLILCQYCARYKILLHIFYNIFIYKKIALHKNKPLAYFKGGKNN